MTYQEKALITSLARRVSELEQSQAALRDALALLVARKQGRPSHADAQQVEAALRAVN